MGLTLRLSIRGALYIDSLEASELKRVIELEQQILDYKIMVTELTRDNRVLKNLIEKRL